jgi:hypothetical protein
MNMPTKFTKPWPDIDPSLRHGSIPGETAEGWVGPDLGDNLMTTNRDTHRIVYSLSQIATAISMNPEADMQGFPGRRLVEESLMAAATFVEMVVDVTHTHATKFFAFTHAVPPTSVFKVTPIRYPVRSQFADDFLHYTIGTIIELAETNRNAAHQGLDPKASNIILEALWTWKAQVMKFWFDKEVSGEISSRELADLYAGKIRAVPSYPDETSETPEAAAVSDALTGVDVLAWLPTEADWTKFAELQERRYKAEVTFQPEDTRQTTEDVLPPGGVNPVSTGGPNP